MTATYDFTGDNAIQQGATFTKMMTWKDSAGSPVNLTGYSAKMQIRKSASNVDVIADLSTVNAGVTLGGSAGTIQLDLTATQTSAITAKTGVYDLELTSANGTVTRFLSGAVEISREVTR